MAAISWYANNLQLLPGSGLGFYGDGGFGASVSVAAWQGRTFITSSNGSYQGAEVNNVKFLNTASGILGQTGSGIPLLTIPNYQSTLNPRFTHTSAIKVQNCNLYCYDRTNINNDPSGVTLMAAELIHPTITQNNTGSGDSTWTSIHGSGQTLSLAPNPGVSGQYSGNGSNSLWTDTTHDWYLALSASPTSIGSKVNFGAYLSLEYY